MKKFYQVLEQRKSSARQSDDKKQYKMLQFYYTPAMTNQKTSWECGVHSQEQNKLYKMPINMPNKKCVTAL